MAEIKNTFLSSKMNKDLDDRLIPNGEYIDALNIQVGKSENNDVGALQAILGNSKELISLETNDNLVCIGTFMDNQNNCIYQFLTSYKDPNPAANTLPVGSSREMKITEYNLDLGTYKTLVSGNFLNFAYNKECLILGVNLIEGLLYWTDNRNQPRKINVETARSIPGYYTTEEHISVAKYAPVDPIFMYKKVSTKVTVASNFPLGSAFDVEDTTGIEIGMTLNYSGATLNDANIVTEINGDTITCYLAVNPGLNVGDEITFLSSTMTNESDDPNWPGDPDFIEAKYIRFSYRFRFDDNEYSIMAPFTQIAYIPKQKGYFIKGNEEDAYKSTVINWMENNVNNIELMIPLPDVANKISSSYKIKEIDILYKESDSAVVKVLETIEVTALQSNSTNNIYIQQYQSQNPYKTLPEAQLVRVYDKVPVRALAQDITGNRIIYGNFYDRYTAPATINYNIGVFKKSVGFTNYIEYPNHTLKQNRNYQVGIILSDKFGRSSSVILSSIDKNGVNLAGSFFGGSSIYSPYIKEGAVDFSVKSWMGNALFMVVNDPIASSRNIPSGTPGLYAVQIGNGFEIDPLTPVVITNTSISFETVSGPSPLVGQYLRGQYKDYVKITKIVPLSDPPIYNTDGRASDLYLENIDNPPDTKYAYTINPIGWYSYKVVVRQQEHDYYNVYLPGILDGYPDAQTFGSQVVYSSTNVATLENAIDFTVFPQSETGNTAHAVLINDNINKVPRDLAEVGPDQKQYRSSVELYGRVSNGSVKLGGTIGIQSDPPPGYDQRTDKFSYDPNDPTYGEDWLSVAPGDGIQSVEANTPIPGSPPIPNTDAWYANTVVVKNDKANGIIYFTPLNIIRGANSTLDVYDHYIITKAENLQYYPSRKADVVSSIATSKEFNFVGNSVTNVKGTAGLNFYQMQSDPLIGRISTVSNIGVTSDKGMVPFLAVYETNPTESLLDIFWETSTTGLISDLNWDVLTGFDGPVALTDEEFQFWEDQNPSGLDSGTGDPESPYITESFFPVSNLGILLNDTSATLQVSDLNNTDKSGLFILEQNTTLLDPQYGSYRIKIDPASVFVFGPLSYLEDNFVFTLTITRITPTGTSIVPLQITGRLGNRMPYLTPDEACINGYYNKNISQDATNILTVTARNGCFNSGSVKDDYLRFEIISQNPPSSPNYFSIDPASGALTLDDSFVPIGSYELEIKVTDAVDFAINPPMGVDTIDVLPKFSSMSQTCIIVITVNNPPVNTWLQPGYNLDLLNPYEGGNYPVLQQPCRDTTFYNFPNWQPGDSRTFAIDPMVLYDYTYSIIQVYVSPSTTPLSSTQYEPDMSDFTSGLVVGIRIKPTTNIPPGASITINIAPGENVKITDKYGLWVVAAEPLLNRVDLFPTGGDPAPAELDPNDPTNTAFFAQLPAVPLMSNAYGPPPAPLATTKAYNTFDNIEAKNAINNSVTGVLPVGLQQGTLRWTVRLFISSYLAQPADGFCQPLTTIIEGYARIIIFRRMATDPAIGVDNPNPWTLVNEVNGVPDNNNVIGTGVPGTVNKGGFTSGLRSNVPSTNPNVANDDTLLGAKLPWNCGGEKRGYREVTFTTENPDQINTYEWAVAVWYKDESNFAQITPLPVDDCNCELIDYRERMYVTVGVEDANYTYPDWEPEDDNTQGVTTAYKYYTGLEYGLSLDKTTYAIPFTAQDANIVNYVSSQNTVLSVSNTAPLPGEVITIKLVNTDTQIAPGIAVDNVTTGGIFGTVSGAYFIDPIDGKTVVPIETSLLAVPSPQPGNPITFSFQMDAVLADPNLCPIPTPIPEPVNSGVIYATTPEGSEVEQFYEDELLTTPWYPTGDPDTPDAFYTFTQWDTQYFNTEVCNSIGIPQPLQTSQATRPQMFPWWSAKMTASGKVIKQPIGTPPDDHYTVQTALKFANTNGIGFQATGELLGRNLKERRYGAPDPGIWTPYVCAGPPPPIP
jgi:hypothetical protein